MNFPGGMRTNRIPIEFVISRGHSFDSSGFGGSAERSAGRLPFGLFVPPFTFVCASVRSACVAESAGHVHQAIRINARPTLVIIHAINHASRSFNGIFLRRLVSRPV